MTDKSEFVIPTGPIDVLDQTVEIQSATLDSTDNGVAFFHDGEKFVFGLFRDGAGLVTRFNAEVALAMGQAMQEAAILAHADIEAVRAAEKNARKRVEH